MDATSMQVSSNRYARIVSIAFAIFCLVATCLSLLTMISTDLLRLVTPYVGWNSLSFYLFACSITPLLRYQTNPRPFLLTSLGYLFLGLFFGLVDVSGMNYGRSDNPMLDYHPLRPLFTLVIPGLWLVLIMTALASIKSRSGHTS